MPHFIDNYTPTADPSSLSGGFSRHEVYNLTQEEGYSWSLFVNNPALELGLLQNSKQVEILDNIQNLEDNWDSEGALSPPNNVIQMCRSIIFFMSAVGQNVYNVAPGSYGEVMIDFRNKSRSLELLLYPDQNKYVKIDPSEKPVQGNFTVDLLPELISWLNK
jgi:hypothetical protein